MIVVTVPGRGEFTVVPLAYSKVGEVLVRLAPTEPSRWVPRDWVRPA